MNEFLKEFSIENETTSAGLHHSTCLNFLFSFLCKLLLESIKQLSLVSSNKSKKNANNKQQETFFAQLLPVLFSGLKSDLIQFKQLSHLVLAFVFEKFELNRQTLNKALFCICKGSFKNNFFKYPKTKILN